MQSPQSLNLESKLVSMSPIQQLSPEGAMAQSPQNQQTQPYNGQNSSEKKKNVVYLRAMKFESENAGSFIK